MRTILIISILIVPILAQCYQQTEQPPIEGKVNGQIASKYRYFNPFYWFRSSSINSRKNELAQISNRSDHICSNSTAMPSESATSQTNIARTTVAKIPVTESTVLDLITTTTARPSIDVSLKRVRKFFIKKKDKVYETTSPYFEDLGTSDTRPQVGISTRGSSIMLHDN